MKYQFLIPVFLLLTLCTAGFGQDIWTTLSALSFELNERGYVVTYEEAPYDARDLSRSPRSNGSDFRFPSSKPMKFNLSVKAVTEAAGIPALVKEYNESGNPGTFSVISDGKYIHIVPKARIVNGLAEDFQPILSTPVQMSSGQDCAIAGEALTARDVVIQILERLGASETMSGGPPTRFVWILDYGVNMDKYFLNTNIVRYIEKSAGVPPSGQATMPKPVDPSRFGMPVQKQP